MGDVDVSALSQAYIGTTANVKVYGLAGGAAGTTTSEVANDDTVHLYPNAYLYSLADINLLAGQLADATQNRINAQANTNLYIYTAFGGSTPNANANIYQTNYVLVDAGAQVLCVANANLYAVQGYNRADGEGHGEVVVLGVPNELDGGESTDNPIDGVIVNGTVKVGIQHIQNLVIDEQVGGTAPTGTNADGTPYAQEQVGGTASGYGALTSTLTFTIASVDSSNDDLTVNVPEGFNFTNGASVTFVTTSASVPTGNLQNGVSYAINVVTPNTSTGTTTVIQLVDPTTNPAVPVGTAASTLSTDSLQEFGGSFSITSVNPNSYVLTVPVTPAYPLSEGRSVTYTDPSGDATNYTVHVVSGPNASGNEQIQLLDSDHNVVAITPSTATLPVINIDESSPGVGSPTVTVQDLGAEIFNQITQLETLIDTHGTDPTAVAGYQAQITSLNLELISLGLIPPTSSLTIPSVPTSDSVIFINVPDMVAQLGVISVEADFFIGSGALESPGQAEINIINNSPFFLDVGNLTIPTGAGGEITFNGFSVTSNSTIITDNRIPSYANLSSTTVDFNPFITASSSQAPEITIESTYNPSQDPAKYSAQAPDIYVTGTISNTSPNGSITLSNTLGSIVVTPAQNGYSSSLGGALQAATINITAGANFILTTAGFQSIGGNPADQWLGVSNTLEQVNAEGQPQLLTGSKSYTQAGTLPSTDPPAVGSIIAQDNVIISAQYLNINGTVQSGIADYNLDLPSTLNATISQDQTQYDDELAEGTGNVTSLFPLNTGPDPTTDPQGYDEWLVSGDNIQADYNAQTQQIQVDAVDVQGGFMELEGNILSTGNGRINVMDGYGQINVTNDTECDIVLNDLDTGGNGIAGKLVIVDTATGTPVTTTYTTLNGTVTSTTTAANLNTSSQTYSSGTDTAYYNPLAGQVYYWEGGVASTVQITYQQSDDSFWGITFNNQTFNPSEFTASNPVATAGLNLPAGPWIGNGSSPYAGYTFQASNVVTSAADVVDQWQTRTSYGLPPVFGYYTYNNYVVTQSGTVEYYLNSVAAEYQIPISFIGSSSGSIDVVSDASDGGQGNIILGGNITNTSGSVTLTSTHGSIDTDADVTIEAKTIALSAATGIGDSSVINVESEFVAAITTTGGVDLNEVTGPLTYTNIESTGSDANLDGQGNVTVTADGSITPASSSALIIGNLITLTSNNGSIGTSSTWPVMIQAANNTTGGLTASASEAVYIEQQTGNLDLFSVSAFSGDIWLDAASGNIIDNNPVRPLNSATTAQLNALYASLDLLGANPNLATPTDDANNAAVELDAYFAGKTSDYFTYWSFRQVQDVNGTYVADPYSADPQFTLTVAEVSAYETEEGWTAAQVTAYRGQPNRAISGPANRAAKLGRSERHRPDKRGQLQSEFPVCDLHHCRRTGHGNGEYRHGRNLDGESARVSHRRRYRLHDRAAANAQRHRQRRQRNLARVGRHRQYRRAGGHRRRHSIQKYPGDLQLEQSFHGGHGRPGRGRAFRRDDRQRRSHDRSASAHRCGSVQGVY